MAKDFLSGDSFDPVVEVASTVPFAWRVGRKKDKNKRIPRVFIPLLLLNSPPF
jgi:hypothetical protein